MKILTLTLTLTAALLPSQPAAADDARSWKVGNDSFHVYYNDLDMNIASDRARMLKRAERAARRLCDSRLKVEEDECVVATLAEAARGRGGRNLALALAEQRQSRWAKK